MFQFRLRDSSKFFNSFTFLNLPLSMMHDPNLLVLQDVLTKLESQGGRDYLPLNKCILTRLMAHQLLHQNFLYLTHFTRRSMLATLPHGLFPFLDKVFADSPRFKRRKLTPAQALKQLH
jgi:hypothetical protein